MARTESRWKCSIWTDDDEFLDLGPDAKLTYFMLGSQPTVNFCGVQTLAEGRWAMLT